ncbi:MAG: cell division protein CrgA [Acidimicrobiia bacterium]
MAPPKKRGGRVTPKGGPTKNLPTAPPDPTTMRRATESSSRYTPPATKTVKPSPRWLAPLLITLIVVGGLLIMVNYIAWDGNSWVLLLGLALILAGILMATQWR